MSSRNRSFWLGQLAGWGGYVVILGPSPPPLLPAAPVAGALDSLAYKAEMGGTGLLASLVCWRVYERLLPRKPSVALLGTVATGASLVVGTAWAFLFRLVTMPGAKLTP